MKNSTTFILSLLVLLIMACTASKKMTLPGDAELKYAQERWPEASQTSLGNGFTVYTTKCNQCHGLKAISSRSETEWNHAIDKMAPKAKLSAMEKTELTQYILSTRAVGMK